VVRKLLSFKDCLKQGLIRRTPPSRKAAEESLETAKRHLQEAEKNIEVSSLDSAVVMAYTAAFNAARSLLFKDGYREKSQVCVVKYLEETYGTRGIPLDYIRLLDKYRKLRHGVLYRTSYEATRREAKEAVNFTRKFIEFVEILIMNENV